MLTINARCNDLGPPMVVLPPDSRLKDDMVHSQHDSGEFGASVDAGEPVLVQREEEKAVRYLLSFSHLDSLWTIIFANFWLAMLFVEQEIES